MNIETIKALKERAKEMLEDNYNRKIGDEEIYTIICELENFYTAYEKEKEKNKELKEDRKKYAEEYIHNNPWLYKQLNENYILRVESEQKEKQAYIDGTNIADKLCNKKWEDKIKAKIEEYDDKEMTVNLASRSAGKTFQQAVHYEVKKVLQSLLEKE